VTTNLAQEIGGSNRGDQITAKHWGRLADDAGTNVNATLRQVRKHADLVEANLDAAAGEVRAMPAGDHSMLPTVVDAVRARCRRVRSNLTVQVARSIS
jgi:serine/threonine-protein kinase HipA